MKCRILSSSNDMTSNGYTNSRETCPKKEMTKPSLEIETITHHHTNIADDEHNIILLMMNITLLGLGLATYRGSKS